jgi:hypothetical protein
MILWKVVLEQGSSTSHCQQANLLTVQSRTRAEVDEARRRNAVAKLQACRDQEMRYSKLGHIYALIYAHSRGFRK